MTVEIEVIPEDLCDFRVESTTDCPIARAIKRALPSAEVSVGWLNAYIDHKVVKLPPGVIDWISEMCAGNAYAPFAAYLTLP